MIMSRKIMNNTDHVCNYTPTKDQEIKVHSFSSTLLEAIYRSIDREEQPDFDTMFSSERKMKQANARDSCSKREEIEKWMDKRTVSNGFQEINPRRKMLEANYKVVEKRMLSTGMPRNCGPMSSRSDHSSDSSIRVEREFPKVITKIPKSKSTNSGYQIHNPIRATTNDEKMEHHHNEGGSHGRSSHFVKTKSHALKFYREIKKMKQPISPGGKIATLINSLFVTGHSKKAKYTNENDHHQQDHGVVVHQQLNGSSNSKSTCSSASSLSRSCLSHKTSSSSASSTNKATRSVRFSSPNLTVFNEQKPVKIDESSDVIANDIQALLRKYHNEDLFGIYNEFEVEEDDDEDEVSSCDSSDLFELDHLMGPVGIMEAELPVFETTSTRLDANRPIANSLLA